MRRLPSLSSHPPLCKRGLRPSQHPPMSHIYHRPFMNFDNGKCHVLPFHRLDHCCKARPKIFLKFSYVHKQVMTHTRHRQRKQNKKQRIFHFDIMIIMDTLILFLGMKLLYFLKHSNATIYRYCLCRLS
jgi:hypothetical protein